MHWFHFQIGWMNLWILALIIFATPVLLNVIRAKKGQAGLVRATTLPPMSKSERVIYLLIMAPQFLLPLYAIFVPFTANVTLLSIGITLFVMGQTFRFKSIWDYITTPAGELITQGAYHISRNPGYFGATLVYLGMGIAGGSWLIVTVAVYWFIGYQWVTTVEERHCLEQWPDAFPQYKRAVAKNLLVF
ncbi:MAG: DUF1295 domain-containing protein [Anaerolineae bacterium]|nr:DUF1295 domain-containing protein [Anaerolineae bacterium]